MSKHIGRRVRLTPITEFKPTRACNYGHGISTYTYMMQFSSVKDWLSGIRHGKAAASTKETYCKGLLQYCQLVGKDPDQLLQEREREYPSQDKEVRFKAEDTFRNALSAFKGKPSVIAMISASAKSFYKYHRYPLQEQGINYKPDGNRDYIPTQEDILRMYLQVKNRNQSTTQRDEALLLFQAETGLRPQTTVQLRYKHIRAEFEAGKTPMGINVPSSLTKAHIASTSFVLQDCYEALKKYFVARASKGEKIDDESLLFPSIAKVGRALNPDVVSEVISELARMAGLPTAESAQFRFRQYCLRKRLQTILESANIPGNWVDLLLNHQPSHSADASSYSRPSLEQLRTAYAKASIELVILPEFVKSLSENPQMTMTYEGLKIALRLLPLGTEKTLEVGKAIKEIDEASISLSEKYDRLYKLTDNTIRAFRNGGEEFEQAVLPTEEVESALAQGGEWIANLPNNKCIVKRRKGSVPDEEHSLAILRATQGSKGTFGLQEVLSAKWNA